MSARKSGNDESPAPCPADGTLPTATTPPADGGAASDPADVTAATLIDRLNLKPHPEGGWYDEVWSAPVVGDARPDWTVIHYLLRAGERSHWHRVDAEETWLFLAGAPLTLRRAAQAEGPTTAVILGPSPGMERIAVVAPDHWQSAACGGDWTLVACTVTPGFRFGGFTLAPPEFDIPA